MVQLRPLALADWKAVHGWAQREEVCRYQAWGPNTPQQTRAFARAAVDAWSQRPQTRFVYAITLDSQVVGNAELRLHGNRQGEIAYAVHPDLWGQGIATEAARQLLVIGFTTHQLHRIFGTCDTRNRASGRVLAKIGMTYEGRMRQTLLIRDGWRDSDLYAILEMDCPTEVQNPPPDISRACRPYYGGMALDLFAGIPVDDYAAALAWYERLLGRPPTFVASDTEAVWELAEHRSLAIEQRPEHAGHAMHTIFVDDFDALIAQLAARGLEPSRRETYSNGVRKATYHDPDGNEIGFGGAPLPTS